MNPLSTPPDFADETSSVAPRRLLVTNFRPQVGQGLYRCLSDAGYVIHAITAPDAEAAIPSQALLDRQVPGMNTYVLDRVRHTELASLLREIDPCAIVHAPLLGCGPAHLSPEEYETIVGGTVRWLEAVRLTCPTVPFICISSIQVYGDRANTATMTEHDTRFDFEDKSYQNGISESFPLDESTHTLFGAAAAACDLAAQEYGRSFHMPISCLRIDSLCDPESAAEDARDFLTQIIRCCLEGTEYAVSGPDKQVREVIAARDLAAFIDAFIQAPRMATVYNLGGGSKHACSLLEAIRFVEKTTEKSLRRLESEFPTLGRPLVYYSNPFRAKGHYPEWTPSDSWKETVQAAIHSLSGPTAS